MDFTKALDELRRVKEFLSAVAISEETMRQVATLGDEVARLGKEKEGLLSSISSLGGDYAKAKAAHDAAMGRLASDKQAAQSDLDAVQKEIAASKKAFGRESEEHANSLVVARKAHSVALSEMRDEIAVEQAKLDKINDTIKQMTRLGG